MFFVRYVLTTIGAFLITAGLFLLMDSLITKREGEAIDEVGDTKLVEFVRLKAKEASMEEDEKLPEKVEQQEAPPPPDFNMASTVGSGEALALDIDAPAVDGDVKPEIELGDGPSLGGAASDADVIPLVRVQPMYPPSAAQARIEGWVRINFDISSSGSVIHAKVVAADPPSVFDHAALAAIGKWKYKPKVENGERVERHNIMVQLTFELENM